jgi:hypothetical protein
MDLSDKNCIFTCRGEAGCLLIPAILSSSTSSTVMLSSRVLTASGLWVSA